MTEFICPFCATPGQVDCTGLRIVTLTACAGCEAELMVEATGHAFEPDDYIVKVQCDDCGDSYRLGAGHRGFLDGRPVRAIECQGHCRRVLVYDEVTGALEGHGKSLIAFGPDGG